MRIRALSASMALVLLAAIVPVRAQQKPPAGPGFTLTTPAFPDGGEIPTKYSQADPMPVSPKLDWANVPMNAASFVLMMRDPDAAPQKKPDDILHYMIINIPGTARSLAEGLPSVAQLPDGSIQPKNFRGNPGYLAPGAQAPGPHHHYTWELFALDAMLPLGADATRADVLKAMEGHVVGKAVMVGRFHR